MDQHFSVYSFIALLELLRQQSKSLDAARTAPLPVLLSIRLRLQPKWLYVYRRTVAKPSIEQYYMLQSDTNGLYLLDL